MLIETKDSKLQNFHQIKFFPLSSKLRCPAKCDGYTQHLSLPTIPLEIADE